MKVLSYNIYGIKNTTAPTPKWEVRQENIKRILNNILKDNEIKSMLFSRSKRK